MKQTIMQIDLMSKLRKRDSNVKLINKVANTDYINKWEEVHAKE